MNICNTAACISERLNHQAWASRQATSRYRNLAKREDGCHTYQDNKEPPKARRLLHKTTTQRLSSNWKEAGAQRASEPLSGQSNGIHASVRRAEMMTCWETTLGSCVSMMRGKKKKKKRSTSWTDECQHAEVKMAAEPSAEARVPLWTAEEEHLRESASLNRHGLFGPLRFCSKATDWPRSSEPGVRRRYWSAINTSRS